MPNIKVPLSQVHPNPYRNLPEYPIDPAKIERLKASIKKTGFWDNIVARKRKDGSVEIAYGHHRIEALRKLYPRDHPIGVIVRDLEDGTMIQIMASENDEVYSLGPAVINETVKAARDYLREHPDLGAKSEKEFWEKRRKQPDASAAWKPKHEYTAQTCGFLSWPAGRVEEALAQLASFEAVATKRPADKPAPVVVAKKVIESIKTQEQARVFRESIKKYGVPSQHHARLAAEINKKGIGKRDIPGLIAGVTAKPPVRATEEDVFRSVASAATALISRLVDLKPLRRAMKAGDYDASYQRNRMLVALRIAVRDASLFIEE